jgi:tetratricopeptide (TPR) repeat protein
MDDSGNPDSYLHRYPGLKEELKALFHGLDSDEESVIDGRVFGDYRIIREIGSGGMATVYEAEQLSLKRKVALKLLPAHMSFSERAVRKFLREAEAGGRQSHPGIVAIYAVGRHENSHFIAQELVGNGFTLAHAIDRQRREKKWPDGYFPRLAGLFAEIADALHHAHESGVIHRDVKPSNILLAPDGRLKVGDFGMARVDGALALSRTGEFSGTPYYMSPEQALGSRDEIDHRTDVYSLGVTLFEAITLKRPFGGEDTHAVLKHIVSSEPRDPRKLNLRVPRDLATICLKAMDKDPSRRYPSMAEMAEDLRRFQGGEDIAARPVGSAVRLARRLRRNPALTGLTVLAGASVLLLFIYMIWSYPQLVKERDNAMHARMLAVREAEKSGAVMKFMGEMFSAANPNVSGREMKVADVLDRAAQAAGGSLAGKPEIEAQLRSTLGNTYYGLGMFPEAVQQFEAALELLEAQKGSEHRDTLAVRSRLAAALRAKGELKEAETLFTEVISLQEEGLGKEHEDALQSKHNMATTLIEQGKLEDAEKLLKQVIDARRRLLGEDHLDTINSMTNRANLLLELGRPAEAAEQLRKVCSVRESIQDKNHPDAIGSRVNLACALTETGEFDEAEALAVKSLEQSREVLGKDHVLTSVAEFTLASLYLAREMYPEAETLFKQVLEHQRRAYKRPHPTTIPTAINLACTLSAQEKDEEAEALFKETLALAELLLPTKHPHKALLFMHYGEHLARLKRFEQAEEMLLKGLAMFDSIFGPDDSQAEEALLEVIRLYEDWGKEGKAEHYRERLIAHGQ